MFAASRYNRGNGVGRSRAMPLVGAITYFQNDDRFPQDTALGHYLLLFNGFRGGHLSTKHGAGARPFNVQTVQCRDAGVLASNSIKLR